MYVLLFTHVLEAFKYDCVPLFKHIYKGEFCLALDYARDGVNSDERVPRGAYSSEISLLAIETVVIYQRHAFTLRADFVCVLKHS